MRRITMLLPIAAFLLGVPILGGDRDRTQPQLIKEPGQQKADPVKTAALHAGIVMGMAIVCKLDTERVVDSYNAFLQRQAATLGAEDQQVLLSLNAQGVGMGVRMQKERGTMRCPEVAQKMLEAIVRLRTA